MIILLRKPQVLARLAIKKSTLHNRIQDGLFPKPISIGARAVAWPSNEVEAIIQAQIAEYSIEEIHVLVKELITKRKEEDK